MTGPDVPPAAAVPDGVAPFDAASRLHTRADVAGYLQALLSFPDAGPGLVARVLDEVARSDGLADAAARAGQDPDLLRETVAAAPRDWGGVLRACRAFGLDVRVRPRR